MSCAIYLCICSVFGSYQTQHSALYSQQLGLVSFHFQLISALNTSLKITENPEYRAIPFLYNISSCFSLKLHTKNTL